METYNELLRQFHESTAPKDFLTNVSSLPLSINHYLTNYNLIELAESNSSYSKPHS